MDARLLIEGLFTVATFMTAIWIRGMRDDLRELIRKVNDHGERLAVVESRLEDIREG